MSNTKDAVLASRLADERSREVVFVSHCLLNENTRYLGGAFRPGAVSEIVRALEERGTGIYQMRCPEQCAWGGVLKRRMLRAYGSKGGVLYRFRRPLLAIFVWHTRLVYRRLAREVVSDIEDYQRSGFRVVGIVGVGASPSCGVRTTLDLRRSFEVIAATPAERVDRTTMNEMAVVSCRAPGQGLFTRALQRQLARHGLAVPFLEHDLVAEMRGEPQAPLDLAPGSGARVSG